MKQKGSAVPEEFYSISYAVYNNYISSNLIIYKLRIYFQYNSLRHYHAIACSFFFVRSFVEVKLIAKKLFKRI